MRQRFLPCLAGTLLWVISGCQAPPPSDSVSESVARASSRPGLGTEWGETVDSPVISTGFRRASNRPTVLSRISYNDRAGIERLTEGNAKRVGESAILADGLLRIRVATPGGRAFPLWRQGSDYYLEGRKGDRYVIEVENRSSAPFEIVASVDGLDVIDGRSANFQKRGYLIDPGESVRIAGFRRSTGSVAAFRFSSVADSYAEKKYGDTRNVGVLGVAAFHERGSDPRPIDSDTRLRRTADPFPGESGFATPPDA